MSCWLRLLLGKHTEMRIKWKLLYSGIIVFKCGTVVLIDLFYTYTRTTACKYRSRSGKGVEDNLTLACDRGINPDLFVVARGEDPTLTCPSLMEILWENLRPHHHHYPSRPKIESTSINLKRHCSQCWSLIWAVPAQPISCAGSDAREWNFSRVLMPRTLVWARLGVWSGRRAGCSLSSTLNLSLDFWPFTWHCPVISLVSQILASHLTCELRPFTWPLIS